MSHKTAGSVFFRDKKIRSADLSMSQTFYLLTLNQFVGNNTDAWPSQTTLAKAMNATTRSVQKWQKQLEKLGIISVAVGKGRSRTNRYSLNLAALPGATSLNDERNSSFTELNGERRSCETANDIRVNGERRSYRKNKKIELKEQAAFPTELTGSNEFQDAWNDWKKYRREIHKQLSPTTIQRQLKTLAKWGPAAAVDAIENSVSHGWVGLFEPAGRSAAHAGDWANVHRTIASSYSPDLRNSEDAERELTSDQYQAAKKIGFDRIARARADDKLLIAEYRSARRAQA